jgi:hypothetical protein
LTRYTIELFEDGDEWSAVIVDHIVVGKGKNAGDAVIAAIDEAVETEKKFAKAGLDFIKLKPGQQNFKTTFQDMRNHALRVFIQFGVPVFILTGAIIAFYLVIQDDVVNQIAFIRDKLLEHAHNIRIAIERIADKQ